MRSRAVSQRSRCTLSAPSAAAMFSSSSSLPYKDDRASMWTCGRREQKNWYSGVSSGQCFQAIEALWVSFGVVVAFWVVYTRNSISAEPKTSAPQPPWSRISRTPAPSPRALLRDFALDHAAGPPRRRLVEDAVAAAEVLRGDLARKTAGAVAESLLSPHGLSRFQTLHCFQVVRDFAALLSEQRRASLLQAASPVTLAPPSKE